MDGAEFALEAYSACVVAGVVGTLVGHCIWEPSQLLGNSRFWFPGGDSPDQPQIGASEFGMGAVAMGILAGIVGGLTSYLLVTLMRGWHPVFEHIKHIKHQHRWKALRYSALLAVVGAANAAMSFLYPSALWWGEDQLQVVLTRGCSFASRFDEWSIGTVVFGMMFCEFRRLPPILECKPLVYVRHRPFCLAE